MKSLLLKTWPHLLAKRIKSDDGFVPSGCIHVINTRPGEGLVWNKPAKSQVAEEIIFMKSEDIEGLKFFSLFKVSSSMAIFCGPCKIVMVLSRIIPFPIMKRFSKVLLKNLLTKWMFLLQK